jgi:hypothetical protein
VHQADGRYLVALLVRELPTSARTQEHPDERWSDWDCPPKDVSPIHGLFRPTLGFNGGGRS